MKYRKDNNSPNKQSITLLKDSSDLLPVCKYLNCNKHLNTMEYLHGSYCFRHSQEINTAMYKAKMFRFNYANNAWEEQRTIVINYDQYKWALDNKDKTVVRTNQPFYRYDVIYYNDVVVTVYSYNPNKFD